MRTTIFLIIFSVLFLFSGCASKKYFEPSDVSLNVSLDEALPAPIVDVTSDGATLENGAIITDRGVETIGLDREYRLIAKSGTKVLASKKCGDFAIYDLETKKALYHEKFEQKSVVGGTIAPDNNEVLILTFSNNSVKIYNFKTNEVLYEDKGGSIYAIDTRVASPVFMDNIYLIPRLDGKITIFDTDRGRVVKDIIVSSEQFLNNIIYLHVHNDRMIAATATKVISLNPKMLNALELDIRDIDLFHDKVFILTKDGGVILADLDLNILDNKKFEFAEFVGMTKGEFIYFFEKSGYVIATDENLESESIFKTSSKLDDEHSIAIGNRFYYGDSYLELKSNHWFRTKSFLRSF